MEDRKKFKRQYSLFGMCSNIRINIIIWLNAVWYRRMKYETDKARWMSRFTSKGKRERFLPKLGITRYNKYNKYNILFFLQTFSFRMWGLLITLNGMGRGGRHLNAADSFWLMHLTRRGKSDCSWSFYTEHRKGFLQNNVKLHDTMESIIRNDTVSKLVIVY